ncbi:MULTISPECIES: cardiolipin synthase [unclassified Arthrobacter]|uniref:cardiolipin synthase n=1 Tax=unclassified Arthrobacter TaxID=235627 RepID=UPI002DFDB1D2|nr:MULTISPECIES: cardiolipin synthase [unclassified Arthrobacter]MEC5190864.1 cardiolipin synthase [Arthrobacter sp. MP_M4]MEC5202118.1 cardiolipin synthase [Arthrobacter sp. MP_M7]
MGEFLRHPETIAALLLAAHVFLVAAAAVLVSVNRRPSSAIAWILAIIFIPLLGAITFFFVGYAKLPKSRKDKQREVNALVLSRTAGSPVVSSGHDWPEWLHSAVALNNNLGALPMVQGNSAELLPDYNGAFDAMIADVDMAREYVHVEFYILVLDPTTLPFFQALARAAARSVAVRVLSDDLAGLMFPGRKETSSYLQDIGAEYHPMLPLRPFRGQWQRPDLRNHRKIVVIDGRVGFTGSQNLIDASYNKKSNLKRGLQWHELMMRAEGPVVRELDAVFATDWYSETDVLLSLDSSAAVAGQGPAVIDAQVLPSGPSFDNDNNLKLYATLIHKAERRISITSPYFVPEESILMAIVTAAARGLSVELFVSEVGDQSMVYHAQRSYYEALLRAGVRIYLYRAPKVLHSKHFTIDEEVAVIGSSNMDIRSFTLNMEVSVLVHGRTFVDAVREIEDGYRANSRELQLTDWTRRPVSQKALDNLARLTASLQ